MILNQIHPFPAMVPDRAICRALRERFVADDGVQFADLVWRFDRSSVCLVEKHKPGPEMPEGFWSVTYELVDEAGIPRRAHSGDVLAVARRVYGSPAHEDDWITAMRNRNKDVQIKNRHKRHQIGIDAIRRSYLDGKKIVTYSADPLADKAWRP